MRRHIIKLISAPVCTLVLFGALAPGLSAAGTYGWKNTLASALSYLDEEFYAKDGFESHLPVLVRDTDGTVDFHLPNEPLSLDGIAHDPLFQAESSPYEKSSVSAGKRTREKKDYTLTLTEESQPVLEEILWKTEVTNKWYLLGNMYDKSLLRNYLALSIARDMNEYAPEVRYCEVFQRDETGVHYEGVYLLIAPTDSERTHIVRGSDPPEGSRILSTYATQQGFLRNVLYIPPDETADETEILRIESGINLAEQKFYATDYNEFSKYADYVNATKLYDYFLLYELFGNYTVTDSAVYAFEPENNKLWPKASPDFEFSLDNSATMPFDPLDIALEEAPYYDALVKNTNFIKELIERYKLLYQTVMKSSALEERVDLTVQELGEAQKRDWKRWESFYDGTAMYWLEAKEPENDAGAVETTSPAQDRNTYSYEQEIIKLKFLLREHGQYMFSGIAELYDQEDMIGDDAPYVKNTWFFLVFLAIVVIAVRIVRRRTR